ncbi:Uncharacterised protein [Klebsiella pneumoniae]|nr:Uncharacterised protein [Klebsiella pneumoniae]SBH44206.1 Uncharacterised protein [Klebsiella pneumoniae]SXO19573.1 Uncharacterised protein [Klebsiella pneumoniae]SXV94515.1 Uncharacterised protein [Klebsiella pneumoniae]VGH54501.1 Uncharacterised protein [Klebsiella pneumoniae]
MSMSDILTITLPIVQGKPLHTPVLSKLDVNTLRNAVAVLRKEINQ